MNMMKAKNLKKYISLNFDEKIVQLTKNTK